MNNKVSVLMATYNGEKYILEQLQSILPQLKDGDELIVSDDGSTDKTVEIIKSINCDKIKVVNGPKQGFVKNFINAFNYSKNDYVFFCDQDDVWLEGKREIMISAFTEGINLVKHDAVIVDKNLNTIEPSYNLMRGANVSFVKNLWANTFTGCCMAVKREWLNKMLPVPEKIYHDWWFGLLSCKYKCAKVLNDKLILYRRHDDNVSQLKPHSLWYRIKQRIYLYRKIRKHKI